MARAESIGSARQRLGFGDSGGHSIRARRDAAALTTASLAELMNEVNPKTRAVTASLSAGDVHADVVLFIASNGEFLGEAHLHDKGTFFGDTYVLTAALTTVAADKTAFGFQKKGTIGAHDDGLATEQGRSQWLFEHWDLAVASGFKVHLTTSTDVPASQILSFLFLGIGVVLFAYGQASGKGRWSRDAEGNATFEIE